jgi:hypothetical protein
VTLTTEGSSHALLEFAHEHPTSGYALAEVVMNALPAPEPLVPPLTPAPVGRPFARHATTD